MRSRVKKLLHPINNKFQCYLVLLKMDNERTFILWKLLSILHNLKLWAERKLLLFVQTKINKLVLETR